VTVDLPRRPLVGRRGEELLGGADFGRLVAMTFNNIVDYFLGEGVCDGVLKPYWGADERASVSRGANPGTDSQFPANCAGNSVSVPGLRRIATQLPQDG
jgi:hypothetical protein